MEGETKAPVGRLALWPDMDFLSSDRLIWLSPGDVPCDTRCELAAALREAIATQLSQRQREVIEGYFFEGLSQPELSSRLGISQQVIHKCLHGTRRNGEMVGGALKKLRVALAPMLEA